MLKQPLIVDDDDIMWHREHIGKLERWSRNLPDSGPVLLNPRQHRLVVVRMRRRITEIHNGRFFSGEVVDLVCDVSRDIHSNSPYAVSRTAHEREQRSGTSLGFTRRYDAAFVVQHE